MSIFNSLGSNYDLGFAVKALFTSGKANLKGSLEKKYNGEAILLFKGRQAITLALKLLNLPTNSEVAINGFTCYAVYKAIEEANLMPVLIDIPKDDLNFSAVYLEKKLKTNPNIKVVIVQNTLGFPCDIEAISKICKEKNIFLIEDLAHCAGAKYENGVEAGRVGNFTILSFSQDKIIDVVSGGALIIRNKKYQKNYTDYFEEPPTRKTLTDKLYPTFTLIIRSTYGIGLGKFIHSFLKNLSLLSYPMDNNLYKMTSLPSWYQLLAQVTLYNLEKQIKHRKKIANIYKENIDKSILLNSVTDGTDFSSNLRFPIFTKKRDDLIKFLKIYNIYVSDIWYDAPIGPVRYMNKVNYQNDCPNSEKISSLILNLPTHKNVSIEKAKFISERINEWLESL
ncbi:MAG: DegT/DnrJ/EryC1/StrS family aminotransferase [Candidatus Levybacteria bacterium]|nr:DegT/DnrJ/EryC1/StrS family aminotransferase [Candidatus Levybacteria bacterium]